MTAALTAFEDGLMRVLAALHKPSGAERRQGLNTAPFLHRAAYNHAVREGLIDKELPGLTGYGRNTLCNLAAQADGDPLPYPALVRGRDAPAPRGDLDRLLPAARQRRRLGGAS